MEIWTNLLKKIMEKGQKRIDRTGIGTISLFGERLEWDMIDGFPAITKKKLFFKPLKGELSAFLKGYSNLKDFHKLNCHFWDSNCNAAYWQNNLNCKDKYDLGRIYGVQWRSWKNPDGDTIDQLSNVIRTLKSKPYDRRMIVTSWNPGELDRMSLPPCYHTFQFYVDGEDMNHLNLMVHMRSVDMFIGFPYDLASMGLLLSLIANEVNMTPRRLILTMGDSHIYLNHLEQVKSLFSKSSFPLAKLKLNIKKGFKTIDFEPHHAELVDYKSHEFIKADLAV